MDKNGIIGRTEIMRNTINTLMQVAPTQVTIFISGESGTGKEVLARAIHYKSPRRFKPFIAINCGAIAETLLESELFGYEKGAFTGAVGKNKGKFEIADKGTLFLDEVGEMSVNTQIKFLRVLEEQEFMRVGGTETIQVDVRVITATNANLEEAVQKGSFRRDLYYRLKVFSIHLPPLRERKEDIPLLVNLFINRFCKENHFQFQGMTHEAYRRLMDYDWPGNIRELRNIVESIVIMQPQRQITDRDIDSYLMQKQFPIASPGPESIFRPNLPVFVNKPVDQVEREMIFQAVKTLHKEVLEIRRIIEERPNPSQSHSPAGQTPIDTQLNLPLGIPMEEIEKEVIIKTLRLFRGNKKKTAESLKIGLRTLYRKLELYSIEDYY
ncbi:MAG: sigma-54-dependent Fis family transcriptional regulator [Candidatus Delongbacteria bacterium]|nr:sigma-54-dependent Fis family transcriptional regulator [Candidatus Delongbacteria bacterium]